MTSERQINSLPGLLAVKMIRQQISLTNRNTHQSTTLNYDRWASICIAIDNGSNNIVGGSYYLLIKLLANLRNVILIWKNCLENRGKLQNLTGIHT